MSAGVARIARAQARLERITAEIVLAKGRDLELSTWMIAHLQSAVKACIDEPVFREALAECRQAATDYVLNLEPAPARQAVAPPARKSLSREQVDRIFDAHAEAPTLEFRYLITEAIVAELQRRQCWQVNSGARCDIQRAPGERRCPDCNPSAAPAPEPSANTPYDEGPFTLAAPPQPSAQGEPVALCPECNGEGSVRSMTSHLGPNDDYEFDEPCPLCKGTVSENLREPVAAPKGCYPEEWGPSSNRQLTCACGNPDPSHWGKR